MKAEDTSEIRYSCTEMKGVTIPNSVGFMFNAVVTLMSRVVLSCFSLPYHRMLLQSADNFGHSAKRQHCRSAVLTGRCALNMNTYIQVCPVCCVVCSRKTSSVSVCALFMYDVSGLAAVCYRQNFHQLLKQTDRHTPSLYFLRVCERS
jgi:hypothetical protein